MQHLLHQGQHTFLKDPRNRCVGPVVSVTIVTSATDVSQWDGLYPNVTLFTKTDSQPADCGLQAPGLHV